MEMTEQKAQAPEQNSAYAAGMDGAQQMPSGGQVYYGQQPAYQQSAQPQYYVQQPIMGQQPVYQQTAQPQYYTQQPMQGMGAQMSPAEAAAYAAGMAAAANSTEASQAAEPKFDQNRLGEMFSMVDDVMNGEADPSKIMSFLQNSDGDFLKGAVVGAAAMFLLNTPVVKETLAGVFGAAFGHGDPGPDAFGNNGGSVDFAATSEDAGPEVAKAESKPQADSK